jgi:tetratricopeptide (TPR) repeat protein
MMLLKSNIALVQWKKGQLDDAVATLEEVFAGFKNTAVYGSLGYLLILKGDLEKALEFNREAYDYNNQNAVIVDNLGQNYYLMGEYDSAGEVYEKLLAGKPDFPEPYYNYGLVLAATGCRERALELFRKALEQKFSFLSAITREEVEHAIRKLSEDVQ